MMWLVQFVKRLIFRQTTKTYCCSKGNFIAQRSAGAYGASMASPPSLRAVEIIVDNDRTYLIKHRETFADL